ncbi:hypothetical protein Godav_019395 [Gossypium davidsonii]|uniref:Uncharacterized protein n=1 Tax=Gossypium davidsonii TaxID=34287 RepID=A0A7J8QZJ8_GOSDV|nr:hypothetical protein [Gossypium davidsonii]
MLSPPNSPPASIMNPDRFSSLFGVMNGLHYSDPDNLEQLYSSKTTSKLMYYRQDLHSQKKGDLLMKDFLMQIKMFYDQLANCEEVISEPEHVTAILNGIPPEYELILTIISTSTVSLLLDMILVRTECLDEADLALSLNVNSVENCTSFTIMKISINVFTNDFFFPLVDNDAQAFVAPPGVIGDNAWYPNSEATNHITNNVSSLTLSVHYVGSDKVEDKDEEEGFGDLLVKSIRPIVETYNRYDLAVLEHAIFKEVARKTTLEFVAR